MKLSKSMMLIIPASVGVLGLALPSMADIETTTVKTTTVTEGDPVQLKSGISYIVVDPLTGEIKGDFDPTQQVVSIQSLPSGAVIVEHNTGKLVATLNPSGKTISILTAPSFDQLSAAIDKRRSELNQAINTDLGNGTITETQGRDLRTQLDVVGKRQAEDTRRGKMLTYAEAIYLASQLNDISNQLVALVPNSSLPPLIGARFIIKDNEVIMTE